MTAPRRTRRSMHRSLRAFAVLGTIASPMAFPRAALAGDGGSATTDSSTSASPTSSAPPTTAAPTTAAPTTAPPTTAPPTTVADTVTPPATTTTTTPPPTTATTSTTVPEYNGVLVAVPTMPTTPKGPTTGSTTGPGTTTGPVPGATPTSAADPAPGTTTPQPTDPVPGATPTTTIPGAPLVPDIGIAVPQDTTDLVYAAAHYDGIYANGLPVGIAMATTRFLESGNNYSATNSGSSASGAYQVIDMAWNNYGGYPRAYLAPPEVQDQFAYDSFVQILKRNGNNLAAIPVSWYYPIALSQPELMDTVPAPWAGNRLTIRQYQMLWLAKFFELLGQGGPPFLPQQADPLIPSIAFPVLGPVQFWHDFGHPRGVHGERKHEGLDLLGTSGQPLRAAFDGTITRIQIDPRGISGVVITVTRGDGVRANYFHVNDDTPGTTDGTAVRGLRVHPGLEVGTTVKAGQIIGYMGDTGNAVGLPHLHFEIRTPEGIPIDPYPAVLAAQQREQCSVGIGPWSTDFISPEEQQRFLDEFAALPQREQDIIKWVAGLTPPPVVHTILVGPDGARWEIDEGGSVRATGEAALIQPGSGECLTIPERELPYGTGAAGVGRDLLPVDWWDTGVAYSGEVSGDDLLHGDGVMHGERPLELDVRFW